MLKIRFLKVTAVALSFISVPAACSSGTHERSSRGFESRAQTPTAAEVTTTTQPLSMAELALSADGLGPVTFGTQAARALRLLTGALGPAENSKTVPDASCQATRIFSWRGLDVLVNEVGARGAGRAGLVGWSMGVSNQSTLDLKTDKGIGVGSTLQAVKAAYGESAGTDYDPNGPTATITTSDGILIGKLDGLSPTSTVKTLQAGVSC